MYIANIFLQSMAGLLNLFFFIFFLFIYLFIYLFIFGCVGSSFLHEGFLQLRRAGATLHRGAQASHYCGLSCCGAQAPDAQAQQLWRTGLVATAPPGKPCLLNLLMVSFVEQKFLIFKNYLFVYLLWLRQVLVAARGVFIVACGIFSRSMWTSQLWHACSI